MPGPDHLKAQFAPLRAAQNDFAEHSVRAALADLAQDATFRMGHPFGDLQGADAFYDGAYAPLFRAMPDLERRDFIVVAGQDQDGASWLGCGGHYVGTFFAPWLDIPPTGHFAHMRYHEFYRFEGEQIVEMQAIWDIPELMMQAGAWPLAPSLGREGLVPGPFTQDGLQTSIRPDEGAKNCALVREMLEYLCRHPAQGGPEVMEMDRFWHPRMSWYGPAGIGTARGIIGFRNWHQIPFLAAMPDRGQNHEGTNHHFFGDGPYVAVTGWPNMRQTISAPGWLGIAPAGQKITLRSLDFWRLDGGKIRENWVLVDLLDMYQQIGVSPMDRMREANKARRGFDQQTGAAT